VLVREDDAELERRVRESETSARIYANAASWLRGESAYLRKVAKLHTSDFRRFLALRGFPMPQAEVPASCGQPPFMTHLPRNAIEGHRKRAAASYCQSGSALCPRPNTLAGDST
jgi:hypothetical protein